MKTRLAGFTLVELMISVVIFTGIMGTFFSVVGSIRRAEMFRDNTTTLMQAGSYAFEPMIRAIKDADGSEFITEASGKSYCVRGFYVQDVDPSVGIIQGSGSQKLSTLSIIKQVGANNMVTSTLTRRSYYLNSGILYEDTQTSPVVTPQSLGCPKAAWSSPPQTRKLTSSATKVTNFSYSVAVPLLKQDGLNRLAPYASVALTVDYVTPKAGISPLSVQTTVVPTFVYGEKQ